MKVIFIGDIFGKIGRKAIVEIIPKWKKKYKPDFIIANNENLAHGSGITEKTLAQVFDAGIDAMTGGNHTFKGQGMELLAKENIPILRPANYPPGLPGSGDKIIAKGDKKLLLISLIGRVFFNEDFDDPFRCFDDIINRYNQESYDGVLVDFHAEATSEKNAFAYYVDGRAAAVVGTHTHIGTVDSRILAGRTAYVTDVGAVMAIDSVIGENKKGIMGSFLTQLPFQHGPVEQGLCVVSAVLIDIDEKTKKAKSIERIDEEVMIE